MFIVGSETVEELFQTPIPPILWHYTKEASFHSILQTQEMWATEINYLNDAEEFVNWKKYAETYLKSARFAEARKLHGGKIGDFIEATINNPAFTSDFLEVYVLSFSAASDDLYQWRSYADNASGVSLGFDARGLRVPKGTDKAVRFGPCIYDDDRKTFLITGAIDSCIAKLSRFFSDVSNEAWVGGKLEQDRIISQIYGRPQQNREEFIATQNRQGLGSAQRQLVTDILSLAMHCKHQSFHYEQEWRLSLPAEKGSEGLNRQRLTRRLGDKEIPYVKVCIIPGFLEIREIMAGPCSQADLGAIQQIQNGDNAFRTSRSSSPFRY